MVEIHDTRARRWRRLRAVGLASALSCTPLVASPGVARATAPAPVTHVEPAAGYGFLDAAIRAARHHVDLSMYELEDPTIEASLANRARAGVDVRVLLDSAYELRGDNTPAATYLAARGVHVVWAPANQIFHAKYLVIDRATLYVGTGNFTARWYSTTRDFWVTDHSSTDVGAAEGRFTSDFTGTDDHWTGGPGDLVWSPGSTGALVRLIGSARHSLLIENEEMDSSTIESALDAAAQRHVSVKVVMTRDSEWLGALRALAAHGVEVSLLSSDQVYIHAKVICADCTATSGRVFVGSENFSTSSLEYNRELGLITTARNVVNPVRTTAAGDFAIGTRLAP